MTGTHHAAQAPVSDAELWEVFQQASQQEHQRQTQYIDDHDIARMSDRDYNDLFKSTGIAGIIAIRAALASAIDAENARLRNELAGERRRVIAELARQAEADDGLAFVAGYLDENGDVAYLSEFLDGALTAGWLRSKLDPVTDAPEGATP